MNKYFDLIRERVISAGEKVAPNKWKLESCTYEILKTVDGSEEFITAPGLVEVVVETKSGVSSLSILKGSEDSLKFLATSI